MSDELRGYDAWKLASPPEGPECPDCGGGIDDEGRCRDCGEMLPDLDDGPDPDDLRDREDDDKSYEAEAREWGGIDDGW